MAKPLYTIEEVCARLGKNADQVRALVRDGKLREFRDGGKVFYKAEDVDKLTGAAASGRSGSGEVVLEPVDETPSAVTKDPGASDSIALEPIPDEGETDEKKQGTAITAKGISVFDEDELEIDTDPMAKTRISGAVGDEVPLDSAGSGSWLLDLTREADDTSLGAELLDEIYPGEDEAVQAKAAAPAAEEEEPQEAEAPIEEVGAGEIITPVLDANYDRSESVFGGVLVGVLVVLAVGASVAGGVLQHYVPSYAVFLSNQFAFFLLGAVVLVGLSTLVGWLIGKASAPRRG